MKSRILIISDGSRGVPFESVINFFQCQIMPLPYLEQERVHDYSMVIVDLGSETATLQAVHSVRGKVPHMGILVMQDLFNPFELTLFRSIPGFGQFKVVAWKPTLGQKLTNLIQSIIHPEYPAVSSKIAIVLPLYNEESRFNHVSSFLGKLQTLIESSFINVSVYMVNDGSQDETQTLVETFREKFLQQTDFILNVHFFSSYSLEKNTRKAGTYIESLKSIDADTFVFVDADDSFLIDDIARMLNIVQAGYYDIVIGTKDMTSENRPLARRMISFCKRTVTRPFLPKGVNDSQTGLKVLNHTAAQNILPHLHVSSGLAIDLEMMYLAKKLHLRVLQLPVLCMDREGSHIRIVHDSLLFLKTLVKLRSKHADM